MAEQPPHKPFSGPAIPDNSLFDNEFTRDLQKFDRDVTAFFSAQTKDAKNAAALALRDEVADMASKHDLSYVSNVFKNEAVMHTKFNSYIRKSHYDPHHIEFKADGKELNIGFDISLTNHKTVTAAGSDKRADYSFESTTDVGKKIYMWKVEGAHGTSYLLGYLHEGTEGLYPLPSKMEKAFSSSDQLVGEVDLNKMGPEMDALIKREGMFQNGDSLDKHLSPPTLSALKKFLNERHADVNGFMQMKPWLAALALAHMDNPSEKHVPTVDQHFFDAAKKSNLTSQGLETPSEEIQSLQNYYRESRNTSVDELLKDFTELPLDGKMLEALGAKQDDKEISKRLLSSWKAGDDEAIHTAMVDDLRKHPGDKLIWDQIDPQQNARMEARIESLLQSNRNSFIVVGAQRIGGEDGLVQMLRKKGYKVEQVVE